MHAEIVVFGDLAIAVRAGDHIRRRWLRAIIFFIVYRD
jgi:hypothetical protein